MPEPTAVELLRLRLLIRLIDRGLECLEAAARGEPLLRAGAPGPVLADDEALLALLEQAAKLVPWAGEWVDTSEEA